MDTQIIGHTEIQTDLNTLYQSGKMPHALLFHGQKGVGKRLVAEVFARMMLCGKEGVDDSKLTFRTNNVEYAQIEAGSNPDFHILQVPEDKKSISVVQVREVLSKLSLSSDGERVVIIDAAEDMGRAASNALLKTLEEPGQGIHIILICHNISKLLPTIISRCRQFRFAPLEASASVQVLKKNHPDLSQSKLEELALLCAGCPGEGERFLGDAQDILADIDLFFKKMPTRSTLPALEMAEKLQKKDLIPLALEMLLRKIALFARQENPPFIDGRQWSELYVKILENQLDMKELNLTPQLTLEASLSKVQNTLNS